MVFVYAQDCWLGRTLGGTHGHELSASRHYLSPVSVETLADPSPHGAAPPRLLVRPQNLSGEPLLHSPSDELLLPRAAARVAGRAGRVQISLRVCRQYAERHGDRDDPQPRPLPAKHLDVAGDVTAAPLEPQPARLGGGRREALRGAALWETESLLVLKSEPYG